jgi:TolA-binding protein
MNRFSMDLRRMRLAATGVVACALVGVLVGGGPAQAQDANSRLNKVEAEVRALQRKVFPGGDGKFFEPQITPATPTPTPLPGTPASTPITDVLVRIDSVESQLRQLTSQVEQNTNRINQLEARLAASAPVAAAPGALAPAPVVSTPAPSTPTPSASTPPRAAAPSNSRIDAVRAIVKPQSADAGDDEYSYGYRLWEAKFYPEAQQQLKLYLEKYPKHARSSWGRNLLGRAYLDDGNALEAAKWFVQNYQTDKRGDRAPDSLLYLAVSMKQLKDSKRACIALAEFSETYASEAAGRLKGTYDTTRNGLSCA